MKKVQRILMHTCVVCVVAALVLTVLFEVDFLPCGVLKGRDGSREFIAAMVMELLTICVIPVALRLFRFSRIASSLTSAEALLRWGLLRLMMLCAPLIANTLLYYLYLNVAFGYMGIILFLCLVFVLPTKARCEAEVGNVDNIELNKNH